MSITCREEPDWQETKTEKQNAKHKFKSFMTVFIKIVLYERKARGYIPPVPIFKKLFEFS